MAPGPCFIILSQNALTESGNPKIAKRLSIAKTVQTLKKVLYVISFVNKGPVMQIPVQKCNPVTG